MYTPTWLILNRKCFSNTVDKVFNNWHDKRTASQEPIDDNSILFDLIIINVKRSITSVTKHYQY